MENQTRNAADILAETYRLQRLEQEKERAEKERAEKEALFRKYAKSGRFVFRTADGDEDPFHLIVKTTDWASAYACLLDIKEAPKNISLFLEIWIGQNMVAGSVWDNSQIHQIQEDLIILLGVILFFEKKTILYQ